MRKRRKTLSAIYIEWIDSASVYGWKAFDPNDTTMKIRSLGVLVGEDLDSVTISNSIDGQVNPNYNGLTSIPKHVITYRRNFKV